MKIACAALGVAGALVVLAVAATSLSMRALASLSAILASVDALFVTLLGFTLFPGLAKDLDFLSLEHFLRLMMLVGLLFLGHWGFGLTVLLTRRGRAATRRSPRAS